MAAFMSDDRRDLKTLKEGDQDAWTKVFKLFWPLVVEIARRQGRTVLNEEDFKDIAQDVFIKLLKEVQKQYETFNFKPWLMWAARCRTIEVVRKKLGGPNLRSLEEIIEESGDRFEAPAANRLSQAEVHDQAKELQAMFPRLDKLTALLLAEKFCNEEKNESLAEKHRLKVGLVATRISRGLAEIHRDFGDDRT